MKHEQWVGQVDTWGLKDELGNTLPSTTGEAADSRSHHKTSFDKQRNQVLYQNNCALMAAINRTQRSRETS